MPGMNREALERAARGVEAILARVLAAVDRCALVDSPAGGGKTRLVTDLAGALAELDARVAVVAQTNAQAFDLVARIARAWPAALVGHLRAHADDVRLPAAIAALPNVRSDEKLPPLIEARVTVATAARWAYAGGAVAAAGRFDVGLVDEAYQMTSALLLCIADCFDRLYLVGDPGQLAPFATVKDDETLDPARDPVVAAPDAVVLNHPDVPRFSLSISRRLDERAVRVVRPAFYPDLDFDAAAGPGARRLGLRGAAGGVWPLAAEAGWAWVELPERATPRVDPEIVEVVGGLVADLLAARPFVADELGRRELTPDRVAVGVSHRVQRGAIDAELARRGIDGVVVDTANRLQGREVDVMIALHPLSGRRDASAFHLDAGRLCVLTTRHRHACVLVGRAGVARLLEDYPPPGRALPRPVRRDPELDGWAAHLALLEHLERVRVRR